MSNSGTSDMTSLADEMSKLGIDNNLSVLENNVLKALLIQIPHYVKGSLAEELKPALTKLLEDESQSDVSISTQQYQTLQEEVNKNKILLKTQGKQLKKMEGQVVQLNKQLTETTTKLSGYKKQVADLKVKVTSIQGEVNSLNLQLAKCNANANNKINEYNKLQQKVNTQLEVIKTKKEELNKQVNQLKTIDIEKIKQVEASQNFISDKYEEVQNSIKKVADELKKEKNKNEHNAVYSRIDSCEIAGVEQTPDEDCKEIVKNVCKELNYIIRDDTISTAHRLKPRRDGKPPGIIVRFNNRDVRNDVYKLKTQAKEKTHWDCYNIDRLYINECLTPEKRNLLYKTKKLLREIVPQSQKFFVWTYKGCVYLRVDAINAPRISVISENTLDEIASKKRSLYGKPQETPDVEKVPHFVTFPNNITTNVGGNSNSVNN